MEALVYKIGSEIQIEKYWGFYDKIMLFRTRTVYSHAQLTSHIMIHNLKKKPEIKTMFTDNGFIRISSLLQTGTGKSSSAICAGYS